MGLVPGVGGCAETAPATRGAAVSGPRAAPDDGDLWNLTPPGADAIVEADLVALRASPWAAAIMTGGLDSDREQRVARLGYDVFADADRMLVTAVDQDGAGTGTGAGEPRTLTVARGRFDPARISGAFTAVTPGAAPANWRDSPMWRGRVEGEGERAVALVTPQTVVHGDPDGVRGAIDAAWGIVPDARAGVLGELRRALDADRARAALFFALNVTDGMRRRAAGTLEVPEALRRLAARLDLAADLDLTAQALFDDARSAKAAAAIWNDHLRIYRRQRMLLLLGMGPVFDGLKLAIEGRRVHVRLHIPADKREGLAEKLLALVKMIAARRPSPDGPGPGGP